MKRYVNREPWMKHAACKGSTAVFDESLNIRGIPSRKAFAEALTVCNICPVRSACKEYALQEPDPLVGMIAGGLTTKERQTVRKARKITQTAHTSNDQQLTLF